MVSELKYMGPSIALCLRIFAPKKHSVSSLQNPLGRKVVGSLLHHPALPHHVRAAAHHLHLERHDAVLDEVV
jgi:hypothetical protein